MTQSGIGADEASTSLRLRLLGVVELERVTSPAVPDRPAPVGRIALQPKRLALLGCLAAGPSGALQRRDSLVGMFWPELDAEHARGALNKAVHYLRRSLGEGVIVSRGDEELGVDPSKLWCDVAAFHESLAAGARAEALAYYGGDLMPGLFLSDAPEWEKWLDNRRLALRQDALGAAWGLATTAEAAQQSVEAGSWTRRALTLAPEDETVVRRGIELLERIGDRAGALRVYEDFARRLATDYQVEPSADTVALVSRLRSAPASAGTAPPVRASHQVPDRGEEPGPGVPAAAAAGEPAAVGAKSIRSRTWIGKLSIGLLLLATVAGAWYFAVPRAGTVTNGLSARRVVVAAFDNRTGDPTLDVVGQMAADWIIHGLSHIGSVELVPVTAMLTSLRYVRTLPDAGDSAARLAAIARETGAAIVVSGSYYRQGDSLYFSARATDIAADQVLFSLEPVRTVPDAPLVAVETLRARILAGLAPHLDPRMADYARITSSPPSLDAYRAYADGLDRFLAADWRAAVERFATASANDSTYTLPLVMTAIAFANLGDYVRVDSVVRLLAPVRDHLPEYDRMAITAASAWARGDYETSYRAARRVSELAPNTIAHAQVAAEALALNRPREARDVLLSLDPDRGELRGWILYWINLGEAHHALQEYDRELDVAQKAAAKHPSSPAAVTLELRAQAALGRAADVLETARSLAASDRPFAGSVLLTAALELHAHGRAPAARQALQLALEWQQMRPDTISPGARRARAETLYLLGDWQASHELMAALAAEVPGNIGVQGRLGTIAARRGDKREAALMDSLLAGRTEPYLHGANTIWRARIAAQLGETEHAARLLQQSYDEGRWVRIDVHTDVDLEAVRKHAKGRHAAR